MPKLSEATKPRDKSKMVRVDHLLIRPFLPPPPPSPGEQGNVGFIAPTPSQFATDADLRAQRISKGGTWIPLFPAPPQARIATGATAASQAKVATKQVPQVKVGTSSSGAATIAVTPAASPSNPVPLPGPAILVAKNLQQLPDGTSRFARTSVHSSYRPLTNPVTGHDAGSNATINIAAHTMQAGATAVSNSSGSITGLSYSTRYFIYYDDPTLAGGAVSYQATTTKEVTLENSGRFFVGSIITPKATAPNTIGAGDGGVGGQFGSALTLLGSITAVSGASGGSVSNPQNAIDGDPTTDAVITGGTLATESLAVLGFSPAQYPGGVVTLNVRSSASFSGTGAGANATLQFSTDGGNSFTNIYSVAANRSLQTDAVTLPSAQNLALVKINAGASSGGGGGTVTLDLYEVWISVSQ